MTGSLKPSLHLLLSAKGGLFCLIFILHWRTRNFLPVSSHPIAITWAPGWQNRGGSSLGISGYQHARHLPSLRGTLHLRLGWLVGKSCGHCTRSSLWAFWDPAWWCSAVWPLGFGSSVFSEGLWAGRWAGDSISGGNQERSGPCV